jgi:general secretion pathway protein G
MSKNRRIHRITRRRKAFTLLEMMLVVVIIGLLVGVAVINLAGQSDVARKGTTEQTLRTCQNAISAYYMRTGNYPATLQALIPADMPKIPKDAWRHEVIYYVSAAGSPNPYTLFSMGADGQASTQDDINAWTVGE